MLFRLFILIISMSVCCDAHEMERSTSKLDVLMREFIATEDCIIWFGRGCPITKYESRKLDSIEKSKLIDAGLEFLKNDCNNIISNEILTKYYEEREEHSKSLYWAFAGAEKGSNYCMSILRWMYANGIGVVEDQIEASKWMILAATLGNKEEKKLLDIIHDLNAQCSYTNPDHEEGRKRAQDWMRQHLELFINNK